MDIPDNRINEILESNPSQGTLYVILNMLKEKGRLNLVISECLKAVSRYPDDYTLKKILAEAYLEDGRLLEAEGEFEKVIVSIKELAEAYRHQAEIYVRQKREKEAIESLRQYLAFYPENEEVASLLGELQAVLDVPLVEPEVNESDADVIEQETPDDFPEIITATLAETYFEQEKLEDAKDIYKKLVEKDPEDVTAKLRLDEISELMVHEDEAEDLKVDNNNRQKKERMIMVLDSWLNSIKGLAGDGLTAS